jgi:hypothetical protein
LGELAAERAFGRLRNRHLQIRIDRRIEGRLTPGRLGEGRNIGAQDPRSPVDSYHPEQPWANALSNRSPSSDTLLATLLLTEKVAQNTPIWAIAFPEEAADNLYARFAPFRGLIPGQEPLMSADER